MIPNVPKIHYNREKIFYMIKAFFVKFFSSVRISFFAHQNSVVSAQKIWVNYVGTTLSV